jgi:hypothetical protein
MTSREELNRCFDRMEESDTITGMDLCQIRKYIETLEKRGSNMDGTILQHIDETLSSLMFWSFRYFLGRTSAHVSMFTRDLAKAYPYMEEREQTMILKELRDEFRRDDAMRESKSKYGFALGYDCDRQAWQEVLDVAEAYAKEEDNGSS